jgi:hypothetical protein
LFLSSAASPGIWVSSTDVGQLGLHKDPTHKTQDGRMQRQTAIEVTVAERTVSRRRGICSSDPSCCAGDREGEARGEREKKIR